MPRWRHHRVDGVGRLNFDFHTDRRRGRERSWSGRRPGPAAATRACPPPGGRRRTSFVAVVRARRASWVGAPRRSPRGLRALAEPSLLQCSPTAARSASRAALCNVQTAAVLASRHACISSTVPLSSALSKLGSAASMQSLVCQNASTKPRPRRAARWRRVADECNP